MTMKESEFFQFETDWINLSEIEVDFNKTKASVKFIRFKSTDGNINKVTIGIDYHLPPKNILSIIIQPSTIKRIQVNLSADKFKDLINHMTQLLLFL